MNLSSSHATLSGLQNAACPPDSLARDLAALVDDIERTKKWFNAQMDAQLAGLRELRETIETDTPAGSDSAALLLQAPAVVEVPALSASAAVSPIPSILRSSCLRPRSPLCTLTSSRPRSASLMKR